MNKDIRKKAKKNVQNRQAFIIVASIFGGISIILWAISINFDPFVAYWIRFPIIIFSIITGIIYVSMFGFSLENFKNDDWMEEEIEKEMLKLYYKEKKALPPAEEMTLEEKLELKEIEKLKEKYMDPEDYV